MTPSTNAMDFSAIYGFATSTGSATGGGQLSAVDAEIRRLEVRSEAITIGDCIGEGMFGRVHRGEFALNGETIAIKVPHDGNEVAVSDLRREAATLAMLKHRNMCAPARLQAAPR